MKLAMLGTGHATVTECYNTCFVIEDEKQYFMVDGGGGNKVLEQLKRAHIDWRGVRDIFVTHKHIDHLMGIVWMMRMITQNMCRDAYEGDARIYGHSEVIAILENLCTTLLGEKEAALVGERVHMIAVEDGQTCDIIEHEVTFFDIQSTKAKQFGFCMKLEGDRKLTCCGDEPYNQCEEKYAKDADWLLHEAFCLYSEADIFAPYEKHHSTAKDACELAEQLNVKNLILYHTEDKNIKNRKKLYSEEGKAYYSGNLYIPDDLEVFDI